MTQIIRDRLKEVPEPIRAIAGGRAWRDGSPRRSGFKQAITVKLHARGYSARVVHHRGQARSADITDAIKIGSGNILLI